MKIKSRLSIGFSSFIIIIVTISLVSYFFISDLDAIVNEIVQESQEVIDLEEIRVDFLLKYSKLDDYIETQNPRDIESYNEIKQNLKQHFDDAKHTAELLGETEDLLILAEIETEIEKINKIDMDLIQLVNEGKKQEAIDLELYTLEPNIEKVDELLGQIILNEEIGFFNAVEKADEETQQLINYLIIIIGFSLILSIITCFFIYTSISKPITKLKDASMLFGKGKLDTLEISGNDELTDLTKAFNEMVISLKQSHNDLEQHKKDLELKVKQKTRELIKKEEFSILGKIAASVAHDLRNPLSIIRNDIKILKKKLAAHGNGGKFTGDSLQRIDKSVLRMSHEIEDVMALVKTSPLKIERNSLLKIIKSAIEYVPTPKNITIKFPQKDLEFECDSYKLERVFVNLLSNSYEAIGEKSGKIEIRFGGTNNLKIEIEDTGSPVPKEDLQLVFQPFFTTKQNGTGLGLLSCKNIIEQHGGVINTQGNPTIFTILLPKRTIVPKLRN